MKVLIDLPTMLLWAGLTRMVVMMGVVKAGMMINCVKLLFVVFLALAHMYY